MHANSPRKTTAPRILFVDDSRLIRFAAQRFLGDRFDVVLAEDGRQAWNILERDETIRFVVTDLMMPDVDGLELIRRIRASRQRHVRALPILVVTSVEENAGRQRALDAGATELVPKPFSAADLVEPLRKHLLDAPVSGTGRSDATRFPNLERTRDTFVNRLEQVTSFHQRHGLEFSILHAKLDDYHTLVCQFGLKAAEQLIHHAECVIARQLRTEDILGRSGDSVLSMILMATPASGAKRLRSRLREHTARNPARLAGCRVELNVSFGIQCPDAVDGDSADSILEAGIARLAEPANVTRLYDRVAVG